jgi:hypothetical protein
VIPKRWPTRSAPDRARDRLVLRGALVDAPLEQRQEQIALALDCDDRFGKPASSAIASGVARS